MKFCTVCGKPFKSILFPFREFPLTPYCNSFRKNIMSGLQDNLSPRHHNTTVLYYITSLLWQKIPWSYKMMSGSKAPDFDAYGLFRATHSHVSAPLRSVLDMCHWHIAPYPIFAYRGIIIPLLCSYRGGSQGHTPTYEQAHVGLDLLTLVSYIITIHLKRKKRK